MDHTFKAIQTVAISIPIILCSETSAEAQNVPDIDPEQNTQKLVEIESTTAKDLIDQGNIPTLKNELEPQDNSTSLIAQSSSSSPVNIAAVPENLNPSLNPLQLPTKTKEVQININQPIGLEQAIVIAINNNQNLQIARFNLERAQQELRTAKAALFPTLNTELNLAEVDSAESEIQLKSARQQGAILSTSNEDTSNSSFSGNINLTYNLFTGGFRGADIKRAKGQVRINELDLEKITFETRFETARDYYNLQNADSQVKIDQAAVKDAQQTLKDAQLLKQAGIGTKFDVLSAEVELANTQQRLTTAKANQSTASRQLATTLSVGAQVELQTADPIQREGSWQHSLEETIVMAYQNRAELEQLLVQREIDDQQRRISLAGVRPQVSLVAGYNLLDVHADDVSLSDGYNVGMQLNWTLFDGGRAASSARESETDIKIDETQFASQRNQIRFEVEQGYFALTASQKNILTSNKAVKLADESLNLARLRFQAGEGTQIDVIQAQSRLTTARANSARAIIDYNQSLNQLRRAVTRLPQNQSSDSTI